MKGWLPLTLGLLAVVLGAVWTVQGLGYLGGSLMSGNRVWAIAGPCLAVAGLLAVWWGLRTRRRRNSA